MRPGLVLHIDLYALCDDILKTDHDSKQSQPAALIGDFCCR